MPQLPGRKIAFLMATMNETVYTAEDRFSIAQGLYRALRRLPRRAELPEHAVLSTLGVPALAPANADRTPTTAQPRPYTTTWHPGNLTLTTYTPGLRRLMPSKKPEPKTRNYLLRHIDPDVWRALKATRRPGRHDTASAD